MHQRRIVIYTHIALVIQNIGSVTNTFRCKYASFIHHGLRITITIVHALRGIHLGGRPVLVMSRVRTFMCYEYDSE